MSISVAEKRAVFRRLHESGCFVLPNPWDVGSARMLQHLGFRALASTSAGYAWSTGRPDNKVTCDDVIEHLTQLCAAVDLPVNADFEGGFADAPEKVAANVTRAIATGVAGLSIEDSTGDKARPLYDMKLATERIRASRTAIDASGSDVMLVGRCESFFVGENDLKDVITRMVAYANAGADCLYAPGIRTREQITEVIKAVHPKPVNVLVGWPGPTVSEMAELGVRRISIGGALARVAWGCAMRAAKEIAEQGSFAAFADGYPGAELNKMFAK